MAIDYGDWVRVKTLGGKPKGVVIRRCRKDNRYLWVEVDGRDEPLRIREKNLEKIKNGEVS